MSVHPGRIETVHSLRGLAALSVALFHFSNGNQSLYIPALVRAAGAKGWLGVEVFFVISGFILPYSLWRSGYEPTAGNFFRFVWKRVVRLDPPYFATIALVLLLAYLSTQSPGFHGPAFHVNAVQLVLHIGYLNAFADLPWLNPVFWTLAIECQFYLLIALVYPLVASARGLVRITGLGILLFSSVIVSGHQNVVTYYLPLFACGIIVFQLHANICSRSEAVLFALLAAVLLAMRMGLLVMAIGIVSALIIILVPSSTNPCLAFLGTVSYSLYLLHVPIGGRVINLAQRLPPSATVGILAIATATAISLGCAFVLHRLIELPSKRYAGSLQFITKVSSSDRSWPAVAAVAINEKPTLTTSIEN